MHCAQRGIVSHENKKTRRTRQDSTAPPKDEHTTTYLEEAGHGLISTADLDLEEGRLRAIAALGRALNLALLRVVPRARPAKDVLSLPPGEDAARVQRLGDGIFVGAGSTLETVHSIVHGGHGEDVCAVGADWTMIMEGQIELLCLEGSLGRRGGGVRGW